MAYAVCHSLIQTIDRILNLDPQKYPISDEGKKRIKDLLAQIEFVKEFLRKYPKEEVMEHFKISDVSNAANQAEDLMEHFIYEHYRWNLKAEKMAAVGRPRNRTEILYDFRELDVVMDEISPIAEKMAKLQQQLGVHPVTTASSDPVSKPDLDTETVGLEEYLKDIKDSMCGQPSSQRQIIPITGMGGIGKTTLARTVYNDEDIINEFPVRAWIVVSHNYKVENIFGELLYALEQQIPDTLVDKSETVENKLHRILTLKKYLIVVDDLWSAKAWDDIRKAFGDPKKCDGSRIVITTRDETVAKDVTTSPPHKMELMSRENSWILLKKKAFRDRELEPAIEKIAWEVVDGCQGLPLAIVLIGGILLEEKMEAWGDIARDVKFAVESTTEFGKRIALSYTYLPVDLRPCFLYMGGFPEDHEIRISKLIKLWIAEGFVGNENEAKEHLYKLVRRNLPLITSLKPNADFKSCNIHDMVRDMAKSQSLDENYERRQSIGHTDLTRLARAYASTLRSCLTFQPNESSLGGLRKFKLLRVLDVVDTDAYSLPAPVFELFHLRYLAFGCPMEVPYAISRLQNLRALIVRPSKRLRHHSSDNVDLPLEIWMLPLLNHLVSFFDLLPDPKGAASALEKLITLNVVKKLICTEQMMGLLYNLKKLAITYFGDKYPNEDYQLHNLHLLTRLEKLTLVVKEGSLLKVKSKPVFPKTLKKLTLSGWRFPWEYMKGIAALPELQVLKLRDHAFEGGAWSTIKEESNDDDDDDDNDNDEEEEEEEEGKLFVELEYLLLQESDLEVWKTKKDHFPALKRLVLNRCGKLKKISEDMGNILELKLIEVDRTNESLLECARAIRDKQEEDYGRVLIVRQI
ncbi:putative late blight resistance protein homolog R1B-14 isoform X1 [Salvia hispanica]|uniref:putative late blight resistance protein homolog R1B-14 isoform X1 n=1 Tax=Salvia hispanica TaxID=49212 RepID=UPI0020090436|nr:putative late blight resistance protein homolog R1B-14 isoform X1 [Salvia hispanica]XP_047945601.1 putative late blight resistance protein homolog R1B-14 isoform X1 [Salvia hispanica]